MATIVDHARFVEELGATIDAEFAEMPGLRLTEAQIRRRWLLSEAECTAVLDYLTMARHLAQDHCGQVPAIRAMLSAGGRMLK